MLPPNRAVRCLVAAMSEGRNPNPCALNRGVARGLAAHSPRGLRGRRGVRPRTGLLGAVGAFPQGEILNLNPLVKNRIRMGSRFRYTLPLWTC